MQLTIRQNKKIALAAILIVFICVLTLGIIYSFIYPGSKDEKVILYGYSQRADIAYNVMVKPNNLYESTVLGEGMVYLSPLVDSINTTFNYEFKGEREASLKGDYEIVAIMEGYQGEKDTFKTIWTKRFVLQAKTAFTDKNSVYKISGQIPVAYTDYRAFADNLEKDLGISANVKLTVLLNVHLQASTDQGSVEENLSPGLVMFLNTPYFEISKNQEGLKTGAIQKTEKTKAPVNLTILLVYGLVLILAVAALFSILFFNLGTVTRDVAEKKLREIFKKYGNRMVALSGEFPNNAGYSYEVKSIEDLIRLSDETGRPIIYEDQEKIKEITQFGIIDKDILYYWKPKRDKPVLTNSCSLTGGVNHGQSASKDI